MLGGILRLKTASRSGGLSRTAGLMLGVGLGLGIRYFMEKKIQQIEIGEYIKRGKLLPAATMNSVLSG